MKIMNHVFLVPGVVDNPYILVDDDGLTVIDTGLPHSQEKILAYVASLGKLASDVKCILLTHLDLDHVGSLAALHKLTGARTFASRIEAEAIAAGNPSRQIQSSGFARMRLAVSPLRSCMKATPSQVDEILTDSQILPALGGLRVVETSGHTPGHISLFASEVGVLFCGNSLVTDKNGMIASPRGLTWDKARAREAKRKQAALGAHIVCSGHGPVMQDATGKFPL